MKSEVRLEQLSLELSKMELAMAIEQNYDVKFVAALALREKQIQQNYRPIIAVHKWFARRPGSLFRALLLSEFADRSIEETYYDAHSMEGITIADPFMGGGTPLLEANRVGCNVIGVDINPMAAWVVREEIEAIDLESYTRATENLLDHLSQEVGHLYKTRCPITGRRDADAKYFLWVKTGLCRQCRREFDLFPGYVLAKNVRHPVHVLVCASCGELNEVEDAYWPSICRCSKPLIAEGPVRRNKCICPHCGHKNSWPFHGEGPPSHRLFAIEYHNPDLKHKPGRLFKKPDSEDLARVAEAEFLWRRMRPSFVPDDAIPEGDETSRLHRWGYQHFRDLFNPRQLLSLETSARLISRVEDLRLRRALATNFSDLLRYQNMLCRYDMTALKSLDVFSIHGFPVSYVQVESNFLGIRNDNALPVGSGGFINIFDKYIKAKRYCNEPFEVAYQGKKKITIPIRGEWIGERNLEKPGATERQVDIRCASATEIALPPSSLDAVLTDPPYFGMLQYGELMQFCYVWLRKLMGETHPGLELVTTRHEDELTGNETAERGLEHFAEGLARSFRRMALALKTGAPLVFTYHHNHQDAYLAAGMAILDAGLTCSASYPCPAEMGGSIHIHGTGSSILDTVFVCRQRGATPRAWLFEDVAGLAAIMSAELADLRAAGMDPTPGDIRCLAFGHITRMAVWRLRSTWNHELTTQEKFAILRKAMNDIATVDAVQKLLEKTAAPVAVNNGRLFRQIETRIFADAVSF